MSYPPRDGNCNSCKYAMAVDAALKYGKITNDTYQAYVNGTTSIAARAFAICKIYNRFIAERESCSDWTYRDYGPDFGRP